MKFILSALVAVVVFLGFSVNTTDCDRCGRTVLAFGSSAYAAQPPKEVIVPKFCREMVFVWYIRYDVGSMKVSLNSNPPFIPFSVGSAVRGSLLSDWGKQQAATTGQGGWRVDSPKGVSVGYFSIQAISPETYRIDSGQKVLWSYTWDGNSSRGFDNRTFQEKKC